MEMLWIPPLACSMVRTGQKNNCQSHTLSSEVLIRVIAQTNSVHASIRSGLNKASAQKRKQSTLRTERRNKVDAY